MGLLEDAAENALKEFSGHSRAMSPQPHEHIEGSKKETHCEQMLKLLQQEAVRLDKVLSDLYKKEAAITTNINDAKNANKVVCSAIDQLFNDKPMASPYGTKR